MNETSKMFFSFVKRVVLKNETAQLFNVTRETCSCNLSYLFAGLLN